MMQSVMRPICGASQTNPGRPSVCLRLYSTCHFELMMESYVAMLLPVEEPIFLLPDCVMRSFA